MEDYKNGIDILELAKMKFAPAELILKPWLTKKSLSLIWAQTGVGKTWLAMSIAQAVATGTSFLGWEAPTRRKVIYFDGEMGWESFNERMATVDNSSERSVEKGDPGKITGGIKLVTINAWTERKLPNLADPACQGYYSDVVKDSDLIIIDNLATIARAIDGRRSCSDAEIWASVEGWAIKQRSEGKSIIFIHHAGKSGDQLGTSTKEFVLNTVIALTRASDYEQSEGVGFNLKYTKGRDLYGEHAQSLRVNLKEEESTIDHNGMKKVTKFSWQFRPLKDHLDERVEDLIRQGYGMSIVLAETGISRLRYEQIKDNLNKDENYENETIDRDNNRGRKDHGYENDPF